VIKYLLLIAVVFVVLAAMRGARGLQRRGGAQGRPGPAKPAGPQDMIECPVCRLHLPRSEALAGPDGRWYCCAEHGRAGA